MHRSDDIGSFPKLAENLAYFAAAGAGSACVNHLILRTAIPLLVISPA
jgi:hypothetical protein